MLTIIFTVIAEEMKIQILTDKNNIATKILTMLTMPSEQKHQLRKTPFNNIITLLNTIINAKNLKIIINLTEEKINIKNAFCHFHTDLLPNTVLNNTFTPFIMNTSTPYTIHQLPKTHNKQKQLSYRITRSALDTSPTTLLILIGNLHLNILISKTNLLAKILILQNLL